MLTFRQRQQPPGAFALLRFCAFALFQSAVDALAPKSENYISSLFLLFIHFIISVRATKQELRGRDVIYRPDIERKKTLVPRAKK